MFDALPNTVSMLGYWTAIQRGKKSKDHITTKEDSRAISTTDPTKNASIRVTLVDNNTHFFLKLIQKTNRLLSR